MLKRFEGDKGRRLLLESLRKSRLVNQDAKAAEKLAEVGKLEAHEKGKVLIKEGETDNDVYFILSGEAQLSVKGNKFGTRKSNDVVGEMAAVDGTKRRSATLTVTEDLVVLKVTESDFLKTIEEFPALYKELYIVQSDRLRERTRFLEESNNNPVLFVGCSVEGLPLAEEIRLKLDHADIEVVVWEDGIFSPSEYTIDDLQKMASRADFGAFIFHVDDVVRSRGKQYFAPRDNTIFELGLFMGKLDRNRNFIIYDRDSKIKIPSDLFGITPITYSLKSGKGLTSAAGTICTEMKKKIGILGVK